MKTYIKIALFIVTFIALSSILAALYLFNMKHTDMAKAKPDFVITASLLQKDFESDETAASTKYINKIIEVNGKITSVKPGENNILSISLATDSDMTSIICTFPAITDTSKFKVGDDITLRGECSGFLMDVLLNNCAVISK
ncbi:MAG TPA: hypothetical protein VIK07_09815 [Bacteroidales bacterium]